MAENDKQLTIQSGNRGLVLSSLNDMWRFAQCVVSSGLAPKGMEKVESVLVAVQMGAEVGLTPMASLQNIAVINGRPSIWGDAMLAVCQASGLFDESAFSETITKSGNNLTATCTVRRLPDGKPCVRQFSMEMANRAQLTGKAGPWKQYPERMLQMRARSWALRDTFADLLRGMRAAEEEMDCTPTKTNRPRTLAEITQPAMDVEVIATQPDPDPTVARIESHGSNETVSEPERPDTLKSGLDIDAFRAELAKCKTAADVRVCCMEAAKTCGNPDEDATVEKEGKMRLDELKGGTK